MSCKHESDDQVRANLSSDLLPLFDRVASSIKGGATESRTEAFLKYASAHPDEVLATSSHEADTRVRELEQVHQEISKGLGRAPNPYEAKKAARLDRMRDRASRLKSESAAHEASARNIASHIPFGQPILVGHHSEKRHRRDIERIDRGFRKSHDLAKEAEALEQRANRSERVGAISSDDPEAIEKLQEKLAGVERDRARMAEANRWLFWCAMHMSPANALLVQENFVKPLMGRPLDAAELARGEALFAATAPILDAHLAGKTWIAQDHVTLADYSLASGFALAGPAKFPIQSYANIRAWLGRVQELDAWQKTTPPPPPAARS